jgi:hypothetical protein
MWMRRCRAGFLNVSGHMSLGNYAVSAARLKTKKDESNLKRKKKQPRCERCFRTTRSDLGPRASKDLQLDLQMPCC